MQEHNNNDNIDLNRTNAIKNKEKKIIAVKNKFIIDKIRTASSVGEKLSWFKKLPIIFWNFECIKELLDPFAAIGALKMLSFDGEISFSRLDVFSKNNKKISIEPQPVLHRIVKFQKPKDLEIKLSDFGDLKNYQIADGIYDLVDLGLIESLEDINEVCNNELVRAFCVGLFSLFINPDLSSNPDRFKTEYNETKKNFDMQNKLFKILNEFFSKIKDKKTTELRLSDIDNPKDMTIKYMLENRIYCLFVCGIIKNYGELKKCFSKDFYQFFNSIFVKLICYDMDLRLENRSKNNKGDELVPNFDFKFSDNDITKLFEESIRYLHPNIKYYYFCMFDSEDMKIEFKYCKTEHYEPLMLDRDSIFRYLALFVANKADLTEDQKTSYKNLFRHYMDDYKNKPEGVPRKSDPNYESARDHALLKLDREYLIDRKLFMLFCAMGIFGFSMRESLKDFLSDFKLDKERVANAFISVFKSDKNGDNFRSLYDSLKDKDSPVICSIKNLGIGLFEPFIYAVIKSFNFSEIEDILSYPSCCELLSCRTRIRLTKDLLLNGLLVNKLADEKKILTYSDHEKIKSILMFIKISRLLNSSGVRRKFIIDTIFDEKGEKLNNEIKKIFDAAFENYIISKDVTVYELYKIAYYGKIIGLTDKQLLCLKNKVLELIHNGIDKSDGLYVKYIIGIYYDLFIDLLKIGLEGIYKKKKEPLIGLANSNNLSGLKNNQESRVKTGISIDEGKENNLSESDRGKKLSSSTSTSRETKRLEEFINEYEKFNSPFEKMRVILNKKPENENKKYKPRMYNTLGEKRGREKNNQKNYSDEKNSALSGRYPK